jgi:hypothetical protein
MQTSIEWFIEHLLGSGLLRLTKDDHNLYSKLRDEAKEMHKEEIIKSYKDGRLDEELSDRRSKHFNRVAIRYYLETFKKD